MKKLQQQNINFKQQMVQTFDLMIQNTKAQTEIFIYENKKICDKLETLS